jgi:hypothetical protein
MIDPFGDRSKISVSRRKPLSDQYRTASPIQRSILELAQYAGSFDCGTRHFRVRMMNGMPAPLDGGSDVFHAIIDVEQFASTPPGGSFHDFVNPRIGFIAPCSQERT